MRRSLAALVASMGIAWCSSAAAQEAAQPGDIPPASADPEPLWGTPPAPLPTSATPDSAATPAPADPQQPVPRDVRRRMIRHERDITRLNRAMDREGPEYSEEMYESYRSRMTGGIVLLALGGASIVCTFIYALYVIVNDVATSVTYSEDGEEQHHEEDDGRIGEPGQRVALWSMFIGGITGIAIGVPLLITGMQGKKRQDVLRRKDEILAPFDPYAITASLSLFTDSQGNVGGLRLKVTF